MKKIIFKVKKRTCVILSSFFNVLLFAYFFICKDGLACINKTEKFSPFNEKWSKNALNNRYKIPSKVIFPEKGKKLPSFIITGVMKCGTTAVANFLEAHPD